MVIYEQISPADEDGEMIVVVAREMAAQASTNLQATENQFYIRYLVTAHRLQPANPQELIEEVLLPEQAQAWEAQRLAIETYDRLVVP